jgi:uncharacterized protein YlxW (UPF0749 family)
MTKIRALQGVLAVLVLLAFAAGCGQGSDQVKQEVKKKVEAGQEDLRKTVDHVQRDVNDLQKKVNELLKKVDA